MLPKFGHAGSYSHSKIAPNIDSRQVAGIIRQCQTKVKKENTNSTINKLHVSVRIDLSLYVTEFLLCVFFFVIWIDSKEVPPSTIHIQALVSSRSQSVGRPDDSLPYKCACIMAISRLLLSHVDDECFIFNSLMLHCTYLILFVPLCTN